MSTEEFDIVYRMTPKKRAKILHEQVNTFMISCIGLDSYPQTKAVVPGKHRDSLDELYFCTNTSSNFVSEIARSPKANVYFYKRTIFSWRGCLLKGSMEIVTDMRVKEKYWDKKFKNAYAERNFTDPDFCVLKFTPVSGRYYKNFKIAEFAI